MKESSKLFQFIQMAKADLERAIADYKRVKSSGRKKVIGQMETKAALASQTLKYYESLPTLSEAKITAHLEDALKERKRAKTYEHKDPSLAEALFESARSTEQSYLLWCDYHGKRPPKALSGVPLLSPAQPPRITGRGGRRPNAGRPALGHVQVLIKCQPKTAAKLRNFAKSEGLTLGGWLDSHIDSLSGK